MSVSIIKHFTDQNGRPSAPDNRPATPTPTYESPEPATQITSPLASPAGDQERLPVLPPIGTRGALMAGGRAWDLPQGADPAIGDENGALRRDKRALTDAPANPARATLGMLNLPSSHSVGADKTLQAQLITKMGAVPDSRVTVPALSIISRPFDIYKRVVNQPEVLAWLTGKGFVLDSVTIGKNSVSGNVVHNRVVSRQTYTLQDTSGWWQVSARVMHALEALDPTHHGVPYVPMSSKQVSRNVASLFYGVAPPYTEQQSSALVTSLAAGWPTLSTAEIRNRELRLEWSKRSINELDDRENLADALRRVAHGAADSAPLSLSDTEFDVSRTHPLNNDYEARTRLTALVALPEMQGVLADLGAALSGQPVRISGGQLQVLQPISNVWLNVPVGERWSQSLKDALAAVVVLSEKFGHALYSDERHDLRQVARSMNLGALDTAGEARAAANWLRTGFAPPPPDGNYAKLLPQQWAAGTLSTSDKSTLAALATDQKYGANTIGVVLGRQIVTQVTPQETAAKADQIWDQLLNTPQAQEWGRELAQSLNWYKGAADAAISAEQLRGLVVSTIMLSVDPQVPATPGNAAGYHFYTPVNMGREMGAVRKDFEKHLIEKKGVSVRAAPLVAHLFLAHAAPEFLMNPDQKQSTTIPEQLRLPADKIRIGSPAWMTLSLGTALAEVWGGAGSSRGMNLDELGALTTLEAVQPQQQVLAVGLGAKVMLDVGVMTGTVPLRTEGKYTPEDYQKASAGITRRSKLVEQSVEKLGTAPPTRVSLAIKALKQKFPELTANELETITLRKPATRFSNIGTGLNAKRPTLVEAYATGDLHEGWFGFNHRSIKQAEFEARIKSLPKIADEVSGAVDQYLSDTKAAMPGLMKMSLANLPLEDRQALEWGKVDIYRLRRETGETQPQDAAQGNKVAANRGWHGVLLLSQYKDKTRYYEFFPTSGVITDRTAELSKKKLRLHDGVIETKREYHVRRPSQLHRYLQGTQQPFDFNAFLTGEASRPGTSSKVIISQVGASLAGSALKGQGDNADDWVPNTFDSDKSQAIVDAILKGNYIGNYSGHRQALVNYANAVLPSEDTNQGYVDRLMNKENGRALVSMISFIGPLVDIYEGNVSEGVKGLLIDLLSLVGTGGVQASYKAWKAVKLASRLNRQAFRVSFLKEGRGLLRGIFNPLEGFVDLASQPGKFKKFLSRLHRGAPTRVGMGLYVPADVFEKARFIKDAAPTFSDMLKRADATPVPSVAGTIGKTTLQAFRQQNNWYALDPGTGMPTGSPLQGFIPKTP